jgi:hypothetical protein
MHLLRDFLPVLLGTVAYVDGVAASYARPRAGEPTSTAASPCAEVGSSASVALLNSPNGASFNPINFWLWE